MPRFPVRLAVVVLAALALVAPASPAGAARPKAPPLTTGIVDIFTDLAFQNGQAAGTGMIVTPTGEVLTNNHVIRGATSIRVVDVTAHRSYSAVVVGYSVSEDVALLQLVGASKVATVRAGNSASVRVGHRVTALGNAQGAGGAPKPAAGKVTGVGRTIVARDDSGNAETLHDLIATNASVEPGDSGGPLLNAGGRVIGMVTAGGSGFNLQGAAATRGFAIPINKARTIAGAISARRAAAEIHIGPTAFLGVVVSTGATIRQVVAGTPAEAAGLSAGDTITSLAGRPVRSSSDLTAAVLSLTPGATVEIAYTDASGAAATAQITPAEGPPQ